MASKTFACFALAMALCISATLGEIECENLDRRTCAFAVSSSGTRCVLEKNISVRRGRMEKYSCRNSGVKAAEGIRDHVETDECVAACGLDRNSLGISSDALLDAAFTSKFCSAQCYNACPNVVDLYFNLAAGEGVYLPQLCEAKHAGVRRALAGIKSSGAVAGGPEAAKILASAPTAGVSLLAYPPEAGVAPLAYPPTAM